MSHDLSPLLPVPAGRIFLDTTDTARTVNHTGIQRVTRGLYRALQAAGQSTHPVIWSTPRNAYRRPGRLEMRRLENFFSPGLHRLKWLARQQQGLESLRSRWGLLPPSPLRQEEDWLLLPEIWADARRSQLPDQPGRKVAVCHDVLTWQHPGWGPAARVEGFAEYLAALGRMNHVVVPSAETARGLRAFWQEQKVPTAPITVIPWPLDLPPTPADAPRPDREPPVVLSVGTLEPRKNHCVLLDAAEILWSRGTRFRLRMIGRRVNRQPNPVLGQLRSLQAKGHDIVCQERVSDRALVQAYQRAAFTVYLSRGEGFGLPVQESLALGCPCLCSASGAVGELAAGGGCLSPASLDDPEEVAGWMQRLLDRGDPLLNELRAGALARKWPGWPDYCQSLLSLFR